MFVPYETYLRAFPDRKFFKFTYYQMRKIQTFPLVFFGCFHKNPKKMTEIQKSKNPKISKMFLEVLDFWIFGFFVFLDCL